MNLIHWVFFMGTAGVSHCFTLYGQWVFWKYAKPQYRSAVTGCEIARFVLDQAGLPQVGVTPLDPSAEYPSSEGLPVEHGVYEGHDFLSILHAARLAFLKGQLSNVTFWVHLKQRVAFVARFTVFSGWTLFLLGSFVPGAQFLINMGLGCFVTVMLMAAWDLPSEQEIKEKTLGLLQRSGCFQLNELMYLKKLNQAIALWGLSTLIRAPFDQCRHLFQKKKDPYGI